ncbi:hypothetical protein [Streptomyces sp. NPDC051214]|uniref:hypothetical protein n=1 Tax=Streptomyces sp. NPDC051214 TaxID=3155282 RepID=UPI0034444BB4
MTTADFRPTHVVPQDGLSAWEAPDVNRPTAPLDALLPVQLVDRLGDWARIVCANDWSAWVDGRLLIAVSADPPAAGHPLTRTADPAPLLARTEAALIDYRRATRDLATAETDADTFRQRTRGLRVGVVVDGDAMWLYDAEHERWVYCDGARLSTYAVEEGPSVDGARGEAGGGDGGPAGPEPTRVVGGSGDAGRSAGEWAGGGAGSPEPTQVVEAVSGSGTAPARGGEGDAGLAPPSYGDDARRAPATDGEGSVSAPATHRGDPASYGDDARRAPATPRDDPADEPTRRIPPVTADPGPAAPAGER